MAFLTTAQANLAAASTVRMATLVELRFASETKYLWNGAGVTLPIAGAEWEGVGDFGSISGLPGLRTITSEKVTVSLSGVSAEIQAIAKNSRAEITNRLAFIWFQLLDADWQPVGARIPAYWGIMQRLEIDREAATASGGGNRTIGLEIENAFYGRAKSVAGRFTDADQNFRAPGDRFFRFVSRQKSTVVVWPDY